MEDRGSLLLALSISAHPPTPYLLFVGATAVFFLFAMQVAVVVLGLRVFASEACFTLGSHSSMLKLVVSLRYGEVVGIFTLFNDGLLYRLFRWRAEAAADALVVATRAGQHRRCS